MEKPSSGMILLTDQELKEMSDFVEKNYGIVLIKKKTLIQGRLSHTLRERGLSSFREYMDLIYRDKSGVEITNFLNKITTNHSYFMREEEHFRFLRETVLPYLEANRPNKVLRIWSAACSAGQEPFTLAMAIDEYFGSRKAAWDTTILATDLSAQILERAKRAVYPEGEIKDVSAAWRTKYFKKLPDGNYQVCDKIRKEVIYRKMNLMDPFQFKHPFDLILCRNVMIYFDMDTKEDLVEKFYNVTVPGGYLFIGHSEGINRNATRFQYVQPAIYRK